MEIKNKRTGQEINNVKDASSLFSQVKGLMFSKSSFLLMQFKTKKRVSLHSWFVFFPLSIYYLDESREIIEKTEMLPFSWYSPHHAACAILEVPEGCFAAKVGDHLEVRTKISFVREP